MTCKHPKDQCEPYHDSSTVCNACNCVIEQHGKQIEPPHSLSMLPDLPAKPTTKCVAVPVLELEKLEQARVNLYELLSGKLGERQMLELTNITGQIWKVANTKVWD